MFAKRKRKRANTSLPTIENYMKSHIITNISNGIEEIWDESMGEIPWEYYKMIVVKDDGEGNIEAKHFLNIIHMTHDNGEKI